MERVGGKNSMRKHAPEALGIALGGHERQGCSLMHIGLFHGAQRAVT